MDDCVAITYLPLTAKIHDATTFVGDDELPGHILTKYNGDILGDTLGSKWDSHQRHIKHNLWNPDKYGMKTGMYRPLANKGAQGAVIHVRAGVPDKTLAWEADLQPRLLNCGTEPAFEVVFRDHKIMVEVNQEWNVLLFPQLSVSYVQDRVVAAAGKLVTVNPYPGVNQVLSPDATRRQVKRHNI
eukprot:TRINITY_DN67314_c5_g13_i1.p1 TRINITY_DN67314_c5_g13~~TRINITY_DN67314_c5_g13_i1.p1  ORF type:complete len:201 (+),score=23.38 TRINITY_DN67314_c5_g13_i1:50-604(+)